MRRIKHIAVENFKSLVDFEMELSKFSCLIGLNGAGKSTVLQFIDFLPQLVRGNVRGWLSERKWKSADLKSKLAKKVNIDFCIRFSDEIGEPAGRWEASYSPTKNRCTRERIELLDSILEVNINKDSVEIHDLTNGQEKSFEIAFAYEGSILSAIKDKWLTDSLIECKRLISDVQSLDLLAPEHLRQRTRESSGTLGLGGRNLAAFLHQMKAQDRRALFTKLKQIYPQLLGLHAKSLRSGWKQIEISEEYEGEETSLLPAMTTEARHINDGMLRLIALFAELQSQHGFLLLDELENGINPELVEGVLDELVAAPKQVMVTTHSPMILNYLSDDVARSGVIYIYKTSHGRTKAIPFFSIPSIAEKLTVMGPGEAFADTHLTALQEEIDAVTKGT
jgi:ABC-type branched-subunit amino acid transport system ATPase component